MCVTTPKKEAPVTDDSALAGNGFQPVKSADRTLEVLEALAASTSRVSLADLARALDIPKSSLHGILRTLAQRRWVDVDETGLRFGLGLRALLVGASFIESDDVIAQVGPVLDWLSTESAGEAVHLGRLDGPDVIYLAKRESRHALRMYSAIGRRLPAHATALGKSLLAQRTDEEVADIVRWPLARLTNSTITDRRKLFDELATIRETGYAVDNEENADGIRCFAVTLTTSTPAQDAISFSVPIFRLEPAQEEHLVTLLDEARRRISLSPGLAQR
jgi:DNA-binding IclR family transcriptional regulator